MTSPSLPARGVSVALGGAFAIACGIGVGRFIYTPILPAMIEALSLSKANAGLIASANFAGYFAGAIWAAAAHLPGSRRNWLLGAMAASAASTAGMGLVGEMAGFLEGRYPPPSTVPPCLGGGQCRHRAGADQLPLLLCHGRVVLWQLDRF